MMLDENTLVGLTTQEAIEIICSYELPIYTEFEENGWGWIFTDENEYANRFEVEIENDMVVSCGWTYWD